MDPDPVADGRALVAERFPGALAAFLGSGVLSARRTPTSDLDIVVLIDGPPAPFRASLHWRGWPVELFVHDRESVGVFFTRDAGERKPSLARMVAEGVTLSDHGAVATAVRDEARAVLAAGPPPPSRAELELRRYGLTDLLDDLEGSADDGETAIICWQLWIRTAELALVLGGSWLGGGKWLLRELRAADPELAADMVAAIGDAGRLTALADSVLDRAGGRFFDGFLASGRP
jgi:hypothetical protein